MHTPACDYVASNGALFTRAFTPNAKSGPSRSCILTGLNSWQLGPAANHFAFFPEDVRVFPEVLAENGYQVGMTGKGWFPGDPGQKDGKPRELIGKKYNRIKCDPPYPTISNIDYSANFRFFLKKRDVDKPFFFWYGGWEAHRPYTPGSGISGDRTEKSVDRVPEIYPDCATVRTDMCDYAFEIEYFDRHLSKMIEMLDHEGILDNTIIVVTSDNGMSFPRIKGQCYYDSHHMPL
ncbi:MAG TPA: sulfatase-like hydrolase/transferase, partial [Candidatus Alistipes intestinipullorum]|nr:sulfatase-like hydrolase/transferase [Candidatus Alistipes intestinipullorum]